MTNAEMKSNRYLRWHKARCRIAWILARIAEGHTVQIATHTRAVRYTAKHAAMFKATKSGAFVQRGKVWDCIDHTNISAA